MARTAESYDYHSSLLNGPLQKEDSTTYGINDRSTLNDIDTFHVINQLPQDIMHVLFEGVVPHEIQLMLYEYIIVRKIFTLTTLNDRIASFHYSSDETRNKPSPISYQAITKQSSLKQSCKVIYIIIK